MRHEHNNHFISHIYLSYIAQHHTMDPDPKYCWTKIATVSKLLIEDIIQMNWLMFCSGHKHSNNLKVYCQLNIFS